MIKVVPTIEELEARLKSEFVGLVLRNEICKFSGKPILVHENKNYIVSFKIIEIISDRWIDGYYISFSIDNKNEPAGTSGPAESIDQLIDRIKEFDYINKYIVLSDFQQQKLDI